MKFNRTSPRSSKTQKKDLRKTIAEQFRRALRQFQGGNYRLAIR